MIYKYAASLSATLPHKVWEKTQDKDFWRWANKSSVARFPRVKTDDIIRLEIQYWRTSRLRHLSIHAPLIVTAFLFRVLSVEYRHIKTAFICWFFDKSRALVLLFRSRLIVPFRLYNIIHMVVAEQYIDIRILFFIVIACHHLRSSYCSAITICINMTIDRALRRFFSGLLWFILASDETRRAMMIFGGSAGGGGGVLGRSFGKHTQQLTFDARVRVRLLLPAALYS